MAMFTHARKEKLVDYIMRTLAWHITGVLIFFKNESHKYVIMSKFYLYFLKRVIRIILLKIKFMYACEESLDRGNSP